jgi:hypothetical protein
MEIATAVICSLSELEALFPVSLYAPDVVTAVKVKRFDCVVVRFKLHVSERSTAPYIVSTS